jgi:MFS family permease
MTLAMFVLLLIYAIPPDWLIVGIVLLFLAGFLVYGPQSCYWALCPDLLGRYRAATAIGVMNMWAYFVAASTDPLIGWVIDLYGTTPVFALLADRCRRYEPKAAEAITGIDAGAIEATAQLLWESRPVAYYAWSGVEQHTNATQMARAIAQICVLTGSLDVSGGNVLLAGVPANKIDGAELLSKEQRAKALGLPIRPLGPSRWEFVTSGEVYDAALDARDWRCPRCSRSRPR